MCLIVMDVKNVINSFFVFCFLLLEFQDVNVIVILGFGFLGTFLVRYSFSASGFNLLVAVTATQWAIVLNGIESIYYRGTARIHLRRWVKVGTILTDFFFAHVPLPQSLLDSK